MLDLSTPEYAHVAERLRANIITWLATVRPDGRPHLVEVWYLWDGGDQVVIFSKPNNQKVRNLRANQAAMLALDDTDEGEDVVMLEGRTELVPADALRASFPAYRAKYEEGLRSLFGGEMETMAREYSQGIRITLSRVLAYS